MFSVCTRTLKGIDKWQSSEKNSIFWHIPWERRLKTRSAVFVGKNKDWETQFLEILETWTERIQRGFLNLGDLIGKNSMKQGRGYFILNAGNLWCTSLSRCFNSGCCLWISNRLIIVSVTHTRINILCLFYFFFLSQLYVYLWAHWRRLLEKRKMLNAVQPFYRENIFATTKILRLALHCKRCDMRSFCGFCSCKFNNKHLWRMLLPRGLS